MGSLIARKKQLMMQESGLNTTVRVYKYDSKWIQGNLFDDESTIASIFYRFPASSVGRKLVYSGLSSQINVFTDGVYVDYWTARESDTRNVINANTNQLVVSVTYANIDNAYAYLPDTGQILFAGKNTIYYGHRNISELN